MSHFASNKTYGIYKVLKVINNFQFEVECLECKKVSTMDDRIFKNFAHCRCKNRNNENIIGNIIKNYKIIDIENNIAICQCLDCDKVRKETLHVVLNQQIHRCSCKDPKVNHTDMVGKVFGHWTVLSIDEDPHFIIAQCECKTIHKLRGYIVKKGRSKSCGCKNKIKKITFSRIIRSSSKVGKLTIIESIMKYNKSGHLSKCWKVKCDCGKVLIRTESSLRCKTTKNPMSCGCSYRKAKTN